MSQAVQPPGLNPVSCRKEGLAAAASLHIIQPALHCRGRRNRAAVLFTRKGGV